jgi:cytochrome c553
MKLVYVVALVMSASLWMTGMAWAADAPAASPAEAPADAPAVTPMTDAQKAALRKTLETCGTCHGINGRSVAPTFPNLAAQSAPYIELQLHAFKDQSRADPDAQAYMWGMASQLNDVTISGLASYFAAQPAAAGTSGNPALIAQGKKLYEEGVPGRQIPPCATCHGPRAQGMATFPRLAGQHAPYLLKQLLVIQSVLRMAPVMHGVVKDLTRDQMQAVVAYLESL